MMMLCIFCGRAAFITSSLSFVEGLPYPERWCFPECPPLSCFGLGAGSSTLSLLMRLSSPYILSWMAAILLTRMSKQRFLAFSRFPSPRPSSLPPSYQRSFRSLPSLLGSSVLAVSLRGVLEGVLGMCPSWGVRWGVRCMLVQQSSFITKFNYNESPMLVNHSIEKENRSPQSKKREKGNKEIKTPHELLQVLAVNHIILSKEFSSQIINLHHSHDKEIRLFSTKQEEDTQHQLKVKLADYEFELKKVGEDFAEFQLLAKMDRDKHVRRLKEELQSERSKNVEDNSKWEKKFEERQAQHQRDCDAYRARVEQESNKAIADNTARLNFKHEDTLHRLRSAHEQTIQQLYKAIQQLKHDLQHRVRQQRDAHHKDVQIIKKAHEVVLKEKQEQFETKIIAVESERKAQNRATEQSNKESSQLQEKYLHQIGTIEREKRRLQQKYDEMDMKCKVLNKRLQDRSKELEQIKQTHNEQLAKVEQGRKKAVQNARALFNQEKMQFLRDEYSRTEQLQVKLMKLDEVKQTMTTSYDNLLRTLQTQFEKRESKKEDLQAIREYEQRLVSKQRENSVIYQQLRMVQLEKENNDKIYTRIFTSNKKDKKSLSHKDAHDIQALLKQSQTTDFRHLLKLSHK